MPPVTTIDLDHVALATEHLSLLWPRYAGDLGGRWVGGSTSPGFTFGQVAFANGMKVEGLHPFQPEDNDFLRRFLDASGPGPHHITFKVPDLAHEIARATAAGLPPVSVNLDDPDWKEAFLHPKAACGIVVQLAQSSGGDLPPEAPEVPVPEPRVTPPASLDRIVQLVADLSLARRVFVDLLGGRPEHEDATTLDLAWPGPGRLRLTVPVLGSPEAGWMGTRSGRLGHLAFTVADPQDVPGAVPLSDDVYEVAPAHNLGVRLRLTRA